MIKSTYRGGTMDKWMYYTPTFEAERYNPTINANSPWSGHIYFGYDLVRFMKPKKIVELGTYLGTSFFSFCQGVKDEKISTECFAIDTWQGDEHSGFYGEEIYQLVSAVRDTSFPTNSVLIRSTFDEALSSFADETIDLLHIDGLHTYEAVKHDYTTWLPKLDKEGVILFHDIAVMERGFGVYKLWDELKKEYPHMEFMHSYGLGVLFPKGLNEKFLPVIEKGPALQMRYGWGI
jgi:hypothetical protein